MLFEINKSRIFFALFEKTNNMYQFKDTTLSSLPANYMLHRLKAFNPSCEKSPRH